MIKVTCIWNTENYYKLLRKNTINLKEKWTDKTKQIPKEMTRCPISRDQGNTNLSSNTEAFTTKIAK